MSIIIMTQQIRKVCNVDSIAYFSQMRSTLKVLEYLLVNAIFFIIILDEIFVCGEL